MQSAEIEPTLFARAPIIKLPKTLPSTDRTLVIARSERHAFAIEKEPRIVAFEQYGRGLEGLAQRSTYRARWCARGPGDPLPAPQLILGLAPRPCEPSGAGRRGARRPASNPQSGSKP